MRKYIIIFSVILLLAVIVYAQTEPLSPFVIRFLDLIDVPEDSYIGQGGKYVRVHAGENYLELATVAGGGDLMSDGSVPLTGNWDVGNYDITLKSLTGDGTIEGATITEGGVGVPNVNDNLSVFAATTSAQLYGVLSDETGSGAGALAVFSKSPSIDSPTFTTAITATDLIDSPHYVADSIDNEHVNWADIDYLGDEGAITVADNENTAETNAVIFSSGGDVDGGTYQLESDGDLNYNPSTGTLSATVFSGGGGSLTNLDGEQLQNDSVDADSLDWGAFTDLGEGGAVTWGNIAAGELADDSVNNDDINWADIDNLGDEGALIVADTTDATSFVALFESATGTMPIKTDGGLTYNATTANLSTTTFTGALSGNATTCTTASAGDATLNFFGAGVTAVTDGTACTDIEGTGLSIAAGTLNWSAASTDLTDSADLLYETELDDLSELITQMTDVSAFITDDDMPSASTDPDIDAVGEIGRDTDGANESGDSSLRGHDGSNQFLYSKKLKHITVSITNPDSITGWTGRANKSQPIWFNTSGMTFTITEIYAISDADNYDFNLFESNTATDMSDENDTLIDLVECETDGTEAYTDTETTISHAAIEHDHAIIFEHSDGDAGGIIITITGWFNADID